MSAPRTELRLVEPHLLDDTGPPGRGRLRLLPASAVVWLMPTVLLLVLVVGWPVLRTIGASLSEHAGATYARSVEDPLARGAIVRTVFWALLMPVVVTVMGYLLALLSRRGRTGRVMVPLLLAPTALPLVVVGIAFRLLYDPVPGRGTVTTLLHRVAAGFGIPAEDVPALLGPSLVTPALMSAFIWAWTGLAVGVFRTAMNRIPAGLEDAVRAEGGTPWRLFRDVHLPQLRGVVVVLVSLVAVAGARSFDLILVMAPASVSGSAETLAVYVWSAGAGSNEPAAAALSVIWLALVGLGAVTAVAGVSVLSGIGRRFDRPGRRSARPRRRTGRSHRPRGWRGPARRIAAVAAVAVWTLPMLLVVATSLHTPTDAALRRWTGPLSPASYVELGGTPIVEALGRSLVLATVTTTVVVLIAVPAAYALAWIRPPGARLVGMGLLVAAVMPVQVLAGPIRDTLGGLGLVGRAETLLIVHIGLGIPVATLILRNAFVGVPAELIHQVRSRTRGELRRLWQLAPAALPSSLVAVTILQFVQVWNDLVVSLLLSGPELAPAARVLVGEARQFDTNAGVLAAGAVVVSALPVLLVLANHRRVLDGLAAGVVRR